MMVIGDVMVGEWPMYGDTVYLDNLSPLGFTRKCQRKKARFVMNKTRSTARFDIFREK
jgi:hypothetical protein